MGRKTSESIHAGTQSSQQWEYTYEKGLLSLSKDPLGRLHHYTYDSSHRLIAEHVGERCRKFTYNNRGLLTSAEQLSKDHSIVQRSYNPSGNLILEEIVLNGELLQLTKQSWNPSGRSLEVGTHKRDFDYQSGRLSALTCNNLKLSYEYDQSGRLIKQTTPFSSTAHFYNASGLPETKKTQLDHQPYSEALSWTPTGLLAAYQADRSTAKEFSYTDRGHLKSVNDGTYTFDFGKTGKGIRTSAPSHTISPSSLDTFGQIVSENINGKTIQNTYDLAGQISSRSSSKEQEQFEWDPWGNLISITTSSYTWKASYDALGRRLQTSYTPKGWLWSTTAKTTSLFDPEDEF